MEIVERRLTLYQGLSNNDQIDDIEYLRNKLMASLRIPKAFLGYEEGLSGGKATLAAEDVRFARTIERLQKIIVSELTKIGIVHLYSQGFDDSDLIDFSLELQNPSMIHEQEKLELLTQQIEASERASTLNFLVVSGYITIYLTLVTNLKLLSMMVL